MGRYVADFCASYVICISTEVSEILIEGWCAEVFTWLSKFLFLDCWIFSIYYVAKFFILINSWQLKDEYQSFVLVKTIFNEDEFFSIYLSPPLFYRWISKEEEWMSLWVPAWIWALVHQLTHVNIKFQTFSYTQKRVWNMWQEVWQ